MDLFLIALILLYLFIYLIFAANSPCWLLVWQKGLKMSWNPQMEFHYNDISYPYNTAGSFIEYFEGLTYQHANFIFSGASHAQVPVETSSTLCFKILYALNDRNCCTLFLFTQCKYVGMTVLSLMYTVELFTSNIEWMSVSDFICSIFNKVHILWMEGY